jgi:hypothetical protein
MVQVLPEELALTMDSGLIDRDNVAAFRGALAAATDSTLGKRLFEASATTVTPLLTALHSSLVDALGDFPILVKLDDDVFCLMCAGKEVTGFAGVMDLAHRMGDTRLMKQAGFIRDVQLLLKDTATFMLSFRALKTPETRKITTAFVQSVNHLHGKLVHLKCFDPKEVDGGSPSTRPGDRRCLGTGLSRPAGDRRFFGVGAALAALSEDPRGGGRPSTAFRNGFLGPDYRPDNEPRGYPMIAAPPQPATETMSVAIS